MTRDDVLQTQCLQLVNSLNKWICIINVFGEYLRSREAKMIISSKQIYKINIVAFMLLAAVLMLFIWHTPYNHNQYDLSLYPVLVTFTGVLHIQIGCFMILNYWCYREKLHLLPLLFAFMFSGVVLFMALNIYFNEPTGSSQLYNDIAILFLFRHILLTGLFAAALFFYKNEKFNIGTARRLTWGLLIWCVGIIALSVICSGHMLSLPFNLVNPDIFERVFLRHSAILWVLIALWLGIAIYVIKQTRLKSPFWFSMTSVALANLVSLVIIMYHERINSGGWYLARGIEALSAMAVMIALMSDIFRRYKASRQAYALSYENSVRDPMTRLYNRGYFYTGLGSALRLVDEKHPLSLIFCDIDHFKSVNDTWGHIQGDRVIIKLAEIMQNASRSGDIVARIGGEEFAVLLPNTDAQLASCIAERIRIRVEEATPEATNGDFPRKITISLGVFCSTNKTIEVEAFADFADRALYRAKNQGRNCVVTFNGESEAGE